MKAFCKEVILLTQKKIEDAIISFLFAQEVGIEKVYFQFLEEKNAIFSTYFKLHISRVGIGAAAGCLLPEVGQHLQTRLIFPPHFQVGNALGAILIASRKS
jgi:hypothetical protein